MYVGYGVSCSHKRLKEDRHVSGSRKTFNVAGGPCLTRPRALVRIAGLPREFHAANTPIGSPDGENMPVISNNWVASRSFIAGNSDLNGMEGNAEPIPRYGSRMTGITVTRGTNANVSKNRTDDAQSWR